METTTLRQALLSRPGRFPEQVPLNLSVVRGSMRASLLER